ncbi:protein-tyrosine-phosphatase MKP1-like [Syzygium oleosum]|uniref:protein-tyrosine-phosphatase MKP1-like n=1 Tax=Syzygium oleosum TaxID=219896 RepID=UPI0011D1E1F3|nr:protein-tyrosine-phosphatase MKP1-like [Syzygium oleosum]
MLGEEDRDRPAGATRKAYLRSVSWNDRSPFKPNPRPQPNNKARSCLPPLQPLAISRRNVEEWPRAGSDDLGVWPNPQTPRGPTGKQLDSSNSETPVREFQFKRDKLAFFNKECSRIADHIYLGSDAVAQNRELLRQNGITHVLNCVGFVSPEYFKSDLVYKTLWLQDSPSEDITSILYDVFDYFEDVREQGGRVLVHCCQGVSRSTSLVIAYLMWREGQSFEDAFQYVKAARGVTNPNMGFACQLLQCQKRVHAAPSSTTPVLRMYRMAPHSPYDPLHLVPKMLSNPSAERLDSRGAFVVHIPSSIYIWIGKGCNIVMLNKAKEAAGQVVRYERAQGPIVSIKEGEEPFEFWNALGNRQLLSDEYECAEEEPLLAKHDTSNTSNRVGERKVGAYDLDFEIFHKALAGGVVPPFSVSNTGSETCLPARENGWDRLRQKFASGVMKEFVTASKVGYNSSPFDDIATGVADEGSESHDSLNDPSSPSTPSTYPCGSPDSFSYFLKGGSDMTRDDYNEEVESVTCTDPFSSPVPTPSCSSPDSFSCVPVNSPIMSSKSPALSPSTSDYASSFTFSPSSSNWSDLSYFSSRQPSPSGLEQTDPFSVKHVPLLINSCLPYKETPPSPREPCSATLALRATNASLPCKGASPSIAERRGSNPPPRMMLPSVDEPPRVRRNLVRSRSFSLDDSLMEDSECSEADTEGHEGYTEVLMSDADSMKAGMELENEVEATVDRE